MATYKCISCGEIKESEVTYGSGTASYTQSTTGNITGIFHMEDGAYEEIDMTGIEIEGTINEYGWPEFAAFSCNGGICYGNTFDETYGWYGASVHAPLFDLGVGPVWRSGVFSLYIDDPNWYNICPPRMSLIPKM